MIFRNAELHGCSELEFFPDGSVGTLRLPLAVTRELSPDGKTQSRGNTGIELRFVINSGDVKITVRTDNNERGEATVFYGDFVADWPETTKVYQGESTITVIQSPNIARLRKIASEYSHGFSPDVVRLTFRGTRPHFVSIEGDISIPSPEMLPNRKYLAYGSSITHGSIGLHAAYNYTSRVARRLGADDLNYGLAGSACLERAVADYIAENCDFDFATLEMGINILGIEPTDFEERVRYFVSRIATAHPDSKIFAIDLYYCHSDIVGDGKAETFREIVRRVTDELALPNVVYVNGKTVLTSPAGLASGLVHPGPEGICEMVDNLSRIISESI